MSCFCWATDPLLSDLTENAPTFDPGTPTERVSFPPRVRWADALDKKSKTSVTTSAERRDGPSEGILEEREGVASPRGEEEGSPASRDTPAREKEKRRLRVFRTHAKEVVHQLETARLRNLATEAERRARERVAKEVRRKREVKEVRRWREELKGMRRTMAGMREQARLETELSVTRLRLVHEKEKVQDKLKEVRLQDELAQLHLEMAAILRDARQEDAWSLQEEVDRLRGERWRQESYAAVTKAILPNFEMATEHGNWDVVDTTAARPTLLVESDASESSATSEHDDGETVDTTAPRSTLLIESDASESSATSRISRHSLSTFTDDPMLHLGHMIPPLDTWSF